MSTSRTVILGSTGQVGSQLLRLLGPKAIGLSRSEFDLSKISAGSLGQLEDLRPTLLINAAAYTQVEKAEQEQDLAFKINGEAPGRLAEFCRQKDIPFVHYSTDYVFSGKSSRAWTEEDPTGPLNIYGQSKLLGEQQTQAAGGRYLILRTSWVYDSAGNNFLLTILRLGKEREVVRVVNDQFGVPTYAASLAEATLSIVNTCESIGRFPSGIYHLCNQGETSWYGFAVVIFEELKARGFPLQVKRIEPISTEDYSSTVKRPRNSRLDPSKVRIVFGVQLPEWRQDLKRCLDHL
jgi:dTDP-4-dehydrorhamnose reductase